MKSSIILSRSVKNFAGILLGIVLNMYIAFGKIAIFTMLTLLTQEHGRSFHFLASSSISFFKDLKFGEEVEIFNKKKRCKVLVILVFHLFG